ncbi:tetratricopeptide repeat protein [Pseudogemmatithrix spongiicola]|uniref:Tetratricopeptide repeat protein n=1 Tax=Pseudogemmatithrix spongiicola TaxID=3062599 RepID=A0AA49Q5A0_9BACT|nr:tetratricopeptide repeat protein [Gemmatimonadaceae bacterium 'strain 138']WKW15416.1 tetratricopeptide repeat protein [Gemmatimonadaceae bacterium 'strain 318']
MADILKLKKKASDLEAKKQLDKALEVYVEIVDAYEAGDEDQPDIPLYNRVGDMLQKAGRVPEAVSIWEKAVDRYTEGGFYNPAIALCNKILRQSPGRTVIYYKLGKIHAEKGFKADARQNFLEYASRQQKSGNLDEAFRALKEFADLVPGQHDVRITLADQLVKAERKDEAVEQLQLGYSQAKADGDDESADRIASKMKEIDPSIEPEAKDTSSSGGGGGLVFLDVGDESPPRRPSGRVSTADVKRASKAVAGLELLEPVVAPKAPAAPAASAPDVPAPPAADDSALIIETTGLEIETTDLGAATPPPPRGSVIGLEVTNLGEEAPVEEEPVAMSPAADLPLMDLDDETEPPPVPTLAAQPSPADDLPLLDVEPTVAEPLREMPAVAEPLIEMPADAVPFEAPSLDGLDLLEVDAPSPAADLPLMDVGEVEEVMIPAMQVVSLDTLREAVTAAPEDWGAHRSLAEALLEHGQRDEAMAAFEKAMAGFEASGDLDSAGSVADEIVRIDPRAIRSHQKRVEYAFRANNRSKLATAYLELADALLADGQASKARTVYQRVLDITPDDLRAQAAIESIPAEEAPPPPPPRRSTVAQPKPAAPAPAKPAAAASASDDDEYVSLGDWLREDDEPKSTRMVVEEQEPTGDEAADFSDMLRKFKQGVAENVDDEDHEAHYDLGVAYKEMGLVDEAIAEFQKALRGTKERVRTFEALGNCFVEKGQLPVAATILQRALAEPAVRDESLVGVLYLLGAIAEEQQQFADAKRYYERVFAVDIQFRDIGDRLNTVEQQLS